MNPNRKPWVKSFAKRWSKRLLLTALWVGGLGTLFYGIENWRAKRALAEHYEWLKSKGESLDPAQFDPPPVPDEDNAALIPVLECFYKRDADGKRVWAINSIGDVPEDLPEEQKEKLREWAKLKNCMATLFAKTSRTETGSLDHEKCWQELMLMNDRLRKSGPKLLIAPLPEGAASAEDKIKRYLEQFNPILQGLRRAGKLTYCQWPGPRATTSFPRTGISFTLFKTLHVDATFAIFSRDAATALSDLEAMAVLCQDNTIGGGSLISGLVESAQWKVYMKCLTSLLAANYESDEQWARIAQKSPDAKIQDFFKRCLRGERVFREQSRNSEQSVADYSEFEFPKNKRILGAAIVLGPSGWRDRNHIAMSTETQLWIDRLDGNGPPLLAKAANTPFVSHSGLYDFMVDSMGDMRVWVEMAESAEALQLAPVAIALKRYQIKHGTFPDEVSQVVPEFLPQLPLSYFNAMVPKYRRLPEGSFKLWFYGLDGDDDDGRSEDPNKGGPGQDYDIVFTPGPPIP